MNFEKIPPVESGDDLLDVAFRKARERGTQKSLAGNWLQVIRKKEALKLDIVRDVVGSRLVKILKDFPSTTALSSFYQALMHLTLDFTRFKQSLGAIDWAVRQLHGLHRDYVRKVNLAKERTAISALTKSFYGRVSSLLKQIKENLAYLEESRKIMRTYPDVKEMFTICVYGFPNVGKTTLLNTITGTKAKTAAYAFTTKSINAGYVTWEGHKIQVLDVPGTLARKDRMNKIELQAQLAMELLADAVIYVFDATDESGYTLKKQEQLYTNLHKDRPVFIYLSKKDVLGAAGVAAFAHAHYSVEAIAQKVIPLAAAKEKALQEAKEVGG